MELGKQTTQNPGSYPVSIEGQAGTHSLLKREWVASVVPKGGAQTGTPQLKAPLKVRVPCLVPIPGIPGLKTVDKQNKRIYNYSHGNKADLG